MRETIEKQFVLNNLYCSSCAIKIENEIRSLDFIKNASLNFSTKNLHIETYADESDNVSEQIKKIIKEVEPTVNIFEKSIQNKKTVTAKTDKKKIIETLKLTIGAVIFLIALLFKLPGDLKFSLYLISYLLTGFDVLIRAFKNIIRGKIFDENFLMAVTLTLSNPFIFTNPLNISLPEVISLGMDSPDKAEVSTAEHPLITKPSRGILSPGFITITSPILTSSGATLIISLPCFKLAYSGLIAISEAMDFLELLTAMFWRYSPVL